MLMSWNVLISFLLFPPLALRFPWGGGKSLSIVKVHLNAGQLRKDTKDTKSILTTRVGKLSVHAFEDYLLTLTFKYVFLI